MKILRNISVLASYKSEDVTKPLQVVQLYLVSFSCLCFCTGLGSVWLSGPLPSAGIGTKIAKNVTKTFLKRKK